MMPEQEIATREKQAIEGTEKTRQGRHFMPHVDICEYGDVLRLWAGLGYYARARNLHKCAQAIVAQHGGKFPDDEATLLTLPGIGAYTAAAVAAIAFDKPAMPVDGNIERVVARLYAIETPLPAAKPQIRELARTLMPPARTGDFAQALMDLGATICTPTKPACALCPWMDICLARARGIAEELPRRAPKAERPVRHGVAFWAVRPDGRVALRRRVEQGLLGGMIEVPSTDWREATWSEPEAVATAPFQADWRALPGQVRHVFTHFELRLVVWTGRVQDDPRFLWASLDELSDHALPSVMNKVVRHALAQVGRAAPPMSPLRKRGPRAINKEAGVPLARGRQP